jgi:hypothetical protein
MNDLLAVRFQLNVLLYIAFLVLGALHNGSSVSSKDLLMTFHAADQRVKRLLWTIAHGGLPAEGGRLRRPPAGPALRV